MTNLLPRESKEQSAQGDLFLIGYMDGPNVYWTRIWAKDDDEVQNRFGMMYPGMELMHIERDGIVLDRKDAKEMINALYSLNDEIELDPAVFSTESLTRSQRDLLQTLKDSIR